MSSRVPARMMILAAALRNSLRGRRHAPATPGKILVAHHLRLGDTLMLTPLLAKLRERFPAAEIAMTVPESAAPLYQHRPYGVIALAYHLRNPGTVRRLLRQGPFDLAVVPGDNRYSWLARAMGARWIIAFAGDRPAYKSWPVDELIAYPDTPGAWGDMAAGLISGPAPAPYHPGQWAAPDYAAFAEPRRPYGVFHVGASTPLKLWETAKWRELAGRLGESGFHIVWSAGPGEAKYVEDIGPAQNDSNFAGKLDLAQSWRLIQNAGFLVSADTGIAHLGRIVGTPTVVLFGPGSPVVSGGGEFWRSVPSRSIAIDPFPCRDQRILFKREIAWVRRCQRRPGECNDNRCMQAIGVEPVYQAVHELLKRGAAASHQPDSTRHERNT